MPGDHGAHGAFDHRASDFSPQVWAITHPRLSLGALLAAGAALVMGALSIAGDNDEEHPHYPGPGPQERDQLRTLMESPLETP